MQTFESSLWKYTFPDKQTPNVGTLRTASYVILGQVTSVISIAIFNAAIHFSSS